VLTDKLIDLVKQRKVDGKPFFAAMSAQPPHNPYVAPPEFMARHTPAQVELRPNVPLVAKVRERAQRDLAGYYAAIVSSSPTQKAPHRLLAIMSDLYQQYLISILACDDGITGELGLESRASD